MKKYINDLQIGESYKYKELCEILHIEPKGGSSRKAQMKEFEKYVDCSKIGHSIIINSIRKYPLQIKEKRGTSPGSRHDGIYYNYIETIILYALHTSEDYKVKCSVPEALKLVNMINDNYKPVRSNINISSKVLDIDSRFIYNFYDATHKKLKDTFERTLRKMRKRSLVYFKDIVMICKLKLDETTYYNSLGEVIVNHNAKYTREHREAHDSEIKLILEVEEEILRDMGHKDLQSVYLYGDWNKYKKLVEKELKSRGNILFYYDAYSIIINHKGIEKVIKENEMLNSKSTLNSKIVKNLNKSVKKKDEKYETVIAFGTAKNNHRTEEQPGFYENSVKLIDLLISEDCEINMEKDIKDYKIDRFKNASIKVEPIKDDEDIPF